MSKKDWKATLIIGAGVGLLIQPILANLISSSRLTLVIRIGIFVFFTVLGPFALWICSLIAKGWKAFYQFGQFAAVGTLNSFIDLGVLNLELYFYNSASIAPAIFAVFKAISFLCATTNSFIWNRNWTFGSTEKVNAGELTGFYTIALIGWGANVLIATLVESIHPDIKFWADDVAPLVGILVTFIWNFIGYKYFVFRERKPAVPAV